MTELGETPLIPVILSGGSGSRLWPLSRKQYPKQFLALAGDQTLFQQTLQRLNFEGMQPAVLVANQDHRFIVQEQLDAIGLQAQAMLLEPFGRNTAPAVAIAAMQLVA
jgi:mannose-1-phosphate guanylyltransferase/mannose-6-phosphate isomerase